MDRVISSTSPKIRNLRERSAGSTRRASSCRYPGGKTSSPGFFRAAQGTVRGGHYHERKEEVFYVVRGTIKAVFADLDGGGKETCLLEKGMKVRVGTRVGHRFEGIEDSLVVEYSPQYYDGTDASRIDLGG